MFTEKKRWNYFGIIELRIFYKIAYISVGTFDKILAVSVGRRFLNKGSQYGHNSSDMCYFGPFLAWLAGLDQEEGVGI